MSEEKTQLEDAAAPEAEHSSDPETQGEWERAAEAQDQSEHLRHVLDEAREAAQRALNANSMSSGGSDQEEQQRPGSKGDEDSGAPEEDR